MRQRSMPPRIDIRSGGPELGNRSVKERGATALRHAGTKRWRDQQRSEPPCPERAGIFQTQSVVTRGAIGEGSADMTGANRSPTQQTTRGLRCQSVPTPTRAARQGLHAAVLGQDSVCHRRFRIEASDCNLGFRARALHSWSERSAVEPGEAQMGNVGQ